MKVNGHQSASRRPGFTLVEMLTVVGIVGILSGLILTSIMGAKARVRMTQCKHNVRQQGLILSAFVHDHGEYPLQVNWLDKVGVNPDHARVSYRSLFSDHLEDFSNGRGLFDCPSASRPKAFPSDWAYVEYDYNSRGLIGSSSDQWLGLGGQTSSDPLYRRPVMEADVVLPAKMIAMGDNFSGWGGVIQDGNIHCGRNYTARETNGCTARSLIRHQGKANYVFCDGHVEDVSLERLFQSKEPADLQLWNRDGKPHEERL